MTLNAYEKWLHTWGSGARARHDYLTDQHLIEEMLNDSYFAHLYQRLLPGDLIYVRDAAMQQIVLQVDGVYPMDRRVTISVIEVLKPTPVNTEQADNLFVRYRGPRGGFFSVFRADGTLLAKGFRTKDDAEQALGMFRLKGSFPPENEVKAA